ncbi:MAG: hypothetical protein R3E87_14555 [Burkholderiaceae bacterium]
MGDEDNKQFTDDGMQGEGNKDAARRYNKESREFIEKGKVEQAIEDAKPGNRDEAESLRDAEQEGKSRARK